MGKTISYLLLLAILGAGVYYFVFSDRDIFSKSEAAFTVKDTSALGKIFLAKTSGENITLQRTDSGWIVNGKYKARKGTLDNLLRTLKLQQPLYPVAENLHNSVIKTLAGSSIKVELYDRDGDKINTFYVGGSAYNFSGTYMLQEGASRPYVVQIPNFHGFLTPNYATDFDDWRDRSVINLQPEEVKSFSIQYISEPLNSFTIDYSSEKPKVNIDPSLTFGKPLNERRAKVYQKYFTDIYAEGYLNGVPEIDSTIASVPKFCIMEVEAKNGWKQRIEIFKMPLNKRSKNLASADEGDYDIDRFYGVINNSKDTVLLQAFTFDKFFRRAYEFYEEDQTTEMMGLPQNKK
ncbi:MAG TPA: DUF4340 domain-containing protein [Flavipsychrobacter sp.]|nr:DUF4340 domain-containing protein [Flavipsychrobacter sp.]